MAIHYGQNASSGIFNNACNGIKVDHNGNSYLTGKFGGPDISFGNDTLFNFRIQEQMFS
jgi:hypothetical protein